MTGKNGMKKQKRNPWLWVPSLYYAEGIPYTIVMMVSVIMYKRLGVSNTDIALYTSWLYLPWVIKPLWSPLVDLLKTKRFWIITMQLIVGAGLGGVALTLPLPTFFKFTLGFMWLLAFSSATHDIAADGFYMLGLSEYEQAWFVGVRSTFYRFAMITGQGLLIIFAGYFEAHTGLPSVEVPVQVNPDMAIHEKWTPPDSIHTSGKTTAELRMIVQPPLLKIPLKLRQRARVDSMIHYAREWNVAHHFTLPEKQTPTQAEIASESAYQRHFVKPLEKYIRRHFGKEVKPVSSDLTGNIGLLYFSLSAPPQNDKEVVVNFGRHTGDKSISLITGNRFVFNRSNWNQKALAVIQLDPKLKKASKAVFKAQAGNIPLAWSITFFFLAALFILFFLYHKFILPFPASDHAADAARKENFLKEFFDTFVLFFRKDRILLILGFLLLYRLAESQLVKLASPFLLDAQEAGGLALTTGQVGFIYGTVGILFLTIGGLLGGFLAAKQGLKFWLWAMALSINLPDVVYVYLSYAQPTSFWIINFCVALEQFGYGFGFTAYMLYMIYVSEGEFKTAHFAIATGFMALGMMIPGMFSGWLQELIGYQHFFIWVMIATIPGFLILPFIPLDKEFGKKRDTD